MLIGNTDFTKAIGYKQQTLDGNMDLMSLDKLLVGYLLNYNLIRNVKRNLRKED